MKKLIMTIGLPRSGKSTWANEQSLPVVNPDSIRLALHGQPFIGIAEPFVWAIAKVMVRALFLSGHEIVILDATNTTNARRDEWKSSAWVREYRIFDRAKDNCMIQANADGMDYLIPIIEKMFAQLELPDRGECV